jgi:hypothetical protein
LVSRLLNLRQFKWRNFLLYCLSILPSLATKPHPTSFFTSSNSYNEVMPKKTPVGRIPYVTSKLKTFYLKAVFVSPGIPMPSREDSRAQMALINSVGIYLLQACRKGEEDKFYERFFNLWFVLWPQTPKTVEDCRRHTVRSTPSETNYEGNALLIFLYSPVADRSPANQI